MNIRGYLTNRTSDFELNISGENGMYHKYFHNECNICFATLGAAWIMDSTLFLTIPGIIAADTTIRAIRGDHGRKAVSGLIGLIREINEKNNITYL